MKGYEEMTRCVQEKAKERQAVNKRRNNRINMIAVLGCCALLTVVSISKKNERGLGEIKMQNIGTNTTTEDHSLQTESKDILQEDDVVTSPTAVGYEDLSPRLTMLCASPNGEKTSILSENVTVPYYAELRVRDVTAMTDEERQQVIAEENAYVEGIFGKKTAETGYARYTRDNAVVTVIQAGSLRIAFNDLETVTSMQISTTANGYIFYPRISGIKYTKWDEFEHAVAIDGDRLKSGLAMLGADTFDMFWDFAPEVADRISKDPNMDLSQLGDRITITVDYTDGKTEVSVVAVQVDSDGKVSIVLEETTVTEG